MTKRGRALRRAPTKRSTSFSDHSTASAGKFSELGATSGYRASTFAMTGLSSTMAIQKRDSTRAKVRVEVQVQSDAASLLGFGVCKGWVGVARRRLEEVVRLCLMLRICTQPIAKQVPASSSSSLGIYPTIVDPLLPCKLQLASPSAEHPMPTTSSHLPKYCPLASPQAA